MTTQVKLLGGLVALAFGAYLAFGVFGIQTAFTDSAVSEDIPDFTSGSASGIASDEVDEEMTDDMNEFMEAEETPAEVVSSDDMPEMEITRAVEGSFIDRSHPGEGTAVVLSNGDGTQQFLRLEEDFATDNGPDLNVYLSAGVTADGDAGQFDDSFIDLGDLKGNIGAQNYELPEGVDLEVYDTVVIWCVRFGVAFTAADLS